MNLIWKNGARVNIPDNDKELINSYLDSGWVEETESDETEETTQDLSKLKKDELVTMAEDNGLEVEDSMTKAEIIALLQE